MRDRRRTAVAAAAVLAAFAVVPPLISALHAPYLLGIATRIVIFGLAALSLDLIVGYGGLVSFGHAAFFGLGAYAAGLLATHGVTAFAIAIPAAIVVAGLAAAVVGALSLRTAGVQFIMITLAFAQMIFFVFDSMKAFGGSDGFALAARNVLPGIDLGDDVVFYYVCLAALAAFGLLLARVVDSRFGLVLRGARASAPRMAAIGFNVYPFQVAAFALAGAGAGLAGALAANLGKFVSPEMLSWTRSGDLLIMVILGGMGTLVGPVLGAALLLGLESALTTMTEHWMLLLGAFLVAAIAFRRGGIIR